MSTVNAINTIASLIKNKKSNDRDVEILVKLAKQALWMPKYQLVLNKLMKIYPSTAFLSHSMRSIVEESTQLIREYEKAFSSNPNDEDDEEKLIQLNPKRVPSLLRKY